MQARAVFEAAAEVQKSGIKVKPEVMIPLVGFKKELDLQVEVVHRVAKEVMAEKKVKLNYMVGTMIEVPRGALTADEIAQTAEFFSFGTNDLTQTCLGMSRDDSGSLPAALHGAGNREEEPVRLDRPDRRWPVDEDRRRKGPQTRPDIKLGICGEHGGDPDSVKFCHRIGLTYVSCSPFRVPVARLAAAQAALEAAAKAPAKARRRRSKSLALLQSRPGKSRDGFLFRPVPRNPPEWTVRQAIAGGMSQRVITCRHAVYKQSRAGSGRFRHGVFGWLCLSPQLRSPG